MKKAAMNMESIVVAVLFASVVFGLLFMTFYAIGEEYNNKGYVVDINNYGTMVNANETNILDTLDQFNKTSQTAKKVETKFNQLEPSFSVDGLTTVYSLAWNVILLIKESIQSLMTMSNSAVQILGVDARISSLLITIVVLFFVMSAIWLMLGRST